MMKKIWALLLAIMMVLSSVPALAEGGEGDTNLVSDPSTGLQTTSGLVSRTKIVGDVPAGDENGLFVLNDGQDTFTIKDGVLTVVSGTITAISDTAKVEMEKGTQYRYILEKDKNGNETKHAIALGGGSAKISTSGTFKYSVIVESDMTLTLGGVDIAASDSEAGIKILPDASVDLILRAENTIVGGANHAGIEVSWIEGDYGSLTIDGSGSLTATGGSGSGGAGIGGSKGEAGVYGDITINGGDITAVGKSNAAGIGSSNNPGMGTSGGSAKRVNDYTRWGVITINGGTVDATGADSAAGIGGGNHTDSGKIYIMGGDVTAHGHTGIGCGLGNSTSQGGTNPQSPGYYFGDVEIGGNAVVHAYANSDSRGAGIGGGMYSDGIVRIYGNANVTAKGGQNSSRYAGGAGIGGGYQGGGKVIISGSPTVNATGGRGAPGIGNGTAQSGQGNLEKYDVPKKGTVRGNPAVPDDEIGVWISGGTITANGGDYAAGIGGGYSSSVVRVYISGGTITANGYKGEKGSDIGGAGIGSGVGKNGKTSKPEYEIDTSVCVVEISGGSVTAIGGWEAAGIGSGAGNIRANVSITGGKVQAYSDGTKFALDTRKGNGSTLVKNTTEGTVLQGTFMFPWTASSGKQDAEGLNPITVTNDVTGWSKTLTKMPAGYRSFATNVSGEGSYTVYTEGTTKIAQGSGAYFSTSSAEGTAPDNSNGETMLLKVESGKLSDNFFLYPVKTIRVDKIVEHDDTISDSDINMTAYFQLKEKGVENYIGEKKAIKIVNGKAQGSVYFVNVPEGSYSIVEMDADGNRQSLGAVFDRTVLKSIETSDNHNDKNTGIISDSNWSDSVKVTNTFTKLINETYTDITVTKVWADNNNSGGFRPDSVTINLLADGEVVDTVVVTGTGNTWTYTFSDMIETVDKKAINYTVTEEVVPGYATSINGLTITNTLRPAVTITAPSAVKMYDGTALTEDGTNPQKPVAVTGLPAGYTVDAVVEGNITNFGTTANKITSYVIRDAAGNDVTSEYVDVTLIDGSLEITKRTVTLTSPGETKVYDGTALTNRTVTVTGDGFVDGEVNNITATGTATHVADGDVKNAITYNTTAKFNADNYNITLAEGTLKIDPRPLIITTGSASKLYDGTPLTNADRTVDGLANGDRITVTANGTITEAGSTPNTYTVNWGRVAESDYTVTDNLGTLTILPVIDTSVTITAPSAEKMYDGTALTEDGSNPQKPVVVTGLPDGYKVEAVVEGSITNFGTTANRITSYVIRDAEGQDVTKVFVNVTLIDGSLGITKRTVVLTSPDATKMYDGTTLTDRTVTVTGDGFVAGEVTDITTTGSALHVSDGEVTNAITYRTAKSFNPDNYDITLAEGALTITPRPLTITTGTASKYYDGKALTDGTATVEGLAEGDNITVTPNGTITEVGTTENTYRINWRNVQAGDYTLTENLGTLTILPVVTISGTKTWNDGNNVDGIRPGSITVHLQADGRTVATQAVINGRYTFENMPKYANGREIVYTIIEDEVPGYTTEVNGYDLTNTHEPLRVSISGTKTWADHEDQDKLRPESITVSLLADGKVIDTRTVTGTGETWSYSFDDLPGYSRGKLITYTVSEDAVEGYETVIVGNNLYNVHQSANAEPETYTLTIRYWADGEKAFDDFMGTYNFGDKYEVKSPVKAGYSVDLETVAGVIMKDTVIDVYYTPNEVKITIYYQLMDGTVVADTKTITLLPGQEYDVPSPEIEGYTATQVRVSGKARTRDAEYVVWYLPILDETDPETGRTLVSGGYSLIDDYGVPLGLGEVNRNAGECVE